MPIRSITRESTHEKLLYLREGEGPGPVCQELGAELRGIMKGTHEDLYGWCEEVIEVRGFEVR